MAFARVRRVGPQGVQEAIDATELLGYLAHPHDPTQHYLPALQGLGLGGMIAANLVQDSRRGAASPDAASPNGYWDDLYKHQLALLREAGTDWNPQQPKTEAAARFMPQSPPPDAGPSPPLASIPLP